MDESAAGVPIEVWRGVFPAREADETGHATLSAQLAAAAEGLVGAAAALGLAGAFSPDSNATLVAREHQVRLIDDVVPGAPMHMTCGVIEMGESDATLLLTLVDSAADAMAATVLTRVAHASSREGRPFPWPRRALERAEALRMVGQAPPLLPMVEPPPAGAQGYVTSARGAATPSECDVFGRMRPDAIMSRLAGGLALIAPGSAGLRLRMRDLRLTYERLPGAGGRFELRSGVPAMSEGLLQAGHWLVDPETDAVWAAAETVWRLSEA